MVRSSMTGKRSWTFLLICYGDLYSWHKGEGEQNQGAWKSGPCVHVVTFMLDELRTQLKLMAKNKASYATGLVVEMLQDGSSMLLQTIVDTFNDILRPYAQMPEVWRVSRVRVLFKKGDVRQSENYPPITLFRILYKLFSRLLNGRMQGVLDGAQSVDQAGFRAGYSVENHLFTVMILVEAALEYNQPLWACAVDYQKALIRSVMKPCGRVWLTKLYPIRTFVYSPISMRNKRDILLQIGPGSHFKYYAGQSRAIH